MNTDASWPRFDEAVARRASGDQRRSSSVSLHRPWRIVPPDCLAPDAMRDDLKAQRFQPLPVRERMIPKANGNCRALRNILQLSMLYAWLNW